MRSLLCVSLCALLAACSGSSESASNPAPIRQVRIDWLGHEAFRFTSSFGLKIITNPYGPGAGAGSLPSKLTTDVLLISSEKPAYNNDAAIENTPTVFRGAVAAGLHNSAGISFRGVPTLDSRTGDVNFTFAWALDGVKFCFAGNLVSPLNAYDLSLIGPVDVLFLPIGVPAGLTDQTRYDIVVQLKPRVVIPMGPSGAVAAWAAQQPHVYRVGGPSVFLSRQTLPSQPLVLLLERR